MSEPFFEFITDNFNSVSNQLYGSDTEEKKFTNIEYRVLPDTPPISGTLAHALTNRKSTRSFGDHPLTTDDLSVLLKFAISKNKDFAGDLNYTFPSGGGFYPIETYILISNVEAFTPGLYHYSTVSHALGLIRTCSLTLREVNEWFGGAFSTMPHVLIMMTMVKSRCIYKYGARIYPLVLLEAGHRAQNLQLCAANIGAGSCVLGGGTYRRPNAFLGVDGMNEHYIYSVGVGKLPAQES